MTKKNSKERRRKARRKADRAKEIRIIHIAKHLVKIQEAFNTTVDELLEEHSIDRAELM